MRASTRASSTVRQTGLSPQLVRRRCVHKPSPSVLSDSSNEPPISFASLKQIGSPMPVDRTLLNADGAAVPPPSPVTEVCGFATNGSSANSVPRSFSVRPCSPGPLSSTSSTSSLPSLTCARSSIPAPPPPPYLAAFVFREAVHDHLRQYGMCDIHQNQSIFQSITCVTRAGSTNATAGTRASTASATGDPWVLYEAHLRRRGKQHISTAGERARSKVQLERP